MTPCRRRHQAGPGDGGRSSLDLHRQGSTGPRGVPQDVGELIQLFDLDSAVRKRIGRRVMFLLDVNV